MGARAHLPGRVRAGTGVRGGPRRRPGRRPGRAHRSGAGRDRERRGPGGRGGGGRRGDVHGRDGPAVRRDARAGARDGRGDGLAHHGRPRDRRRPGPPRDRGGGVAGLGRPRGRGRDPRDRLRRAGRDRGHGDAGRARGRDRASSGGRARPVRHHRHALAGPGGGERGGAGGAGLSRGGRVQLADRGRVPATDGEEDEGAGEPDQISRHERGAAGLRGVSPVEHAPSG
ncbi:hypothetical protein MICRO11B_40057 [Micrococcus luteus]|nr:hypothetical protein MICRO11B_40057 [Micrococcus luteus]